MMNGILGIRNHNGIKLYRKDGQLFISESTATRFCRRTITTEIANRIKDLAVSDFIEQSRQLIEGAKREGSPDYYETKHNKPKHA